MVNHFLSTGSDISFADSMFFVEYLLRDIWSFVAFWYTQSIEYFGNLTHQSKHNCICGCIHFLVEIFPMKILNQLDTIHTVRCPFFTIRLSLFTLQMLESQVLVNVYSILQGYDTCVIYHGRRRFKHKRASVPSI